MTLRLDTGLIRDSGGRHRRMNELLTNGPAISPHWAGLSFLGLQGALCRLFS